MRCGSFEITEAYVKEILKARSIEATSENILKKHKEIEMHRDTAKFRLSLKAAGYSVAYKLDRRPCKIKDIKPFNRAIKYHRSINGFKFCSRCNLTKPIDEYLNYNLTLTQKRRISGYCRICSLKIGSEVNKKNVKELKDTYLKRVCLSKNLPITNEVLSLQRAMLNFKRFKKEIKNETIGICNKSVITSCL